MKRLTKKALSVILSILMVITVIPASVLPAVAEESATSDTLLEVGRIAYAVGDDNSYNEYTVKTNKTDGNIVIVFKPERNNWQTAGNNLLSVNGVSVISHAGGGGYNLGSTSVAANFTARDITVTINVPTGKATIVDTAGNSGTAYVGPIVEDFTLKINQKYTNSWELTSVVVTQDKGKALGTPYTNNFDTESDVTSGVRGDTTNVKFGVDNSDNSVLHISHNNWNYANAYWETSINANGTDGNIILKTTFDADAVQTVVGNTASGAILTVNGKVIVQNTVSSDNSNRYTVTLGGKTEIKGCTSGKEEVTLVINSETGIATMYFEQNEASAEYPKLTIVEGIELGKIEETISVRYGSNRHPNFYVYSLSVAQYVGEVIVVPSTLLELGETVYGGWANAKKDEYTVKANDTNGNVTIVFTPKNNNWQTEGKNLLSVNGVSLVSTCGTEGNAGYYLGTTAVKTWSANVITAVINPHTGAATISDSAGNSGTANVAVFHDSFVMVVNDLNHNSWTLSSIVIAQDKGEVPPTLYTNNFDAESDVTSGIRGDTTNVKLSVDGSGDSVLHISHNGWNYANAYWETSVETNGTDGMIILKTTIDASADQTAKTANGSTGRGTGAILTVNGKVVIQNSVVLDESNKNTVTLGGKTEIKGCGNGIEVVTLIINPKTGVATMYFDQTAANSADPSYPKMTVVEGIELGKIEETVSVRYGSNRHANFYVYNLSVAQYVGEVIEDGEGEGSDEPDPNTLYTNNFDSAEDVARGTCGNENTVYNENKSALHISYVGEYDYSNAYWETSVKTNGTDGLITLKTTIDADANSHPAAAKATGAILTVNGQVVIKNKEGGKFVTLRDGTEIKGCAANYIEEISLIINPENGRATLIFDQTAANAVDGSYPKTVVVENVALGAIGETFSVRYGTNRHANFYVYSLSVSQESGGGYDMHTCEYTTTVTDATCTTPEFTKTECLECGLFTEPVTAPVLGHKWGNWSKNDGVATRSCSVCGASQSKTVKDVDTTKPLLALGDSLTFGLNTPNTINDSWAKYVANNLGVSSYENYAVHGTEVYQWYGLLTGEAAPNGSSTAEIKGLTLTKDTLTEKIKNAGVVAFSLGSNDLIGGYVGHRSAEKVHETLIKIVDKIHEINPDAIVVSVGYAYGVSMVVGGIYEPSYELFIDFNDLMTETLNSEAYNSFAYYVDVSDVMSDVTLLDDDKVHPTAEGQKKIADRAIKALDALNEPDTVMWEGVPTYVNHFDGTAPTAAVVSWGETGTDGVLTVAPSTTIGNTLNVGSSAFPGKSVITFKFNIPKLPESGKINIFTDRSEAKNLYVCVSSKVNEETQEKEFWASVGNNNDGNSSVRIEENTWYNVTILFAENVDSYSRVYINNTFVGTVKGTVIGHKARNGFANFGGCAWDMVENAATYQIDDFTASAVADEAIVRACGIQRTETLEMKYDVRFVFSVKDIYSDESQIGMDVIVDYGDESKTKNDIQTNIVFEQIEDNYGKETKTAAELGGKYIATIIVDDVPADYPCVKFVVSPYALINGVKYYADTMTATLYSQK